MATGYGHAFDSARMLAAAATVTAPVSGGTMHLLETPMDGLTARMVISTHAQRTGGGAVRLAIMAANNSASGFQRIAMSPAINQTAFHAPATADVPGVGADGLEVLVRFGSDWDWLKYAVDVAGTCTTRIDGIGLVEDGVKFPQFAYYGSGPAYFSDDTGGAQA